MRKDVSLLLAVTRVVDPVSRKCHLQRMENIPELCQGLDMVTFAPGETLIPEGGKTGLLYVLASGSVEVIKGETPVTTICEPGAIFGEISLLLDVPHPASVAALETTVCHVIHGGRDYLVANPRMSLAVAELLASRLRGMIAYLADMKAQYSDRKDHLGMVDELLLDLAHRIPRR